MSLIPQDEAELAAMIRAADGPLSIRGGNTRGGAPRGQPLSTSALRGITLYEPEALTMIARAGTPLSEVVATLAAAGQQLPFEPPMAGLLAGPASTIGGVFAANASGPRRVMGLAARDFLLGIKAVDGQGRIFSNGGRVMKNVTGLDLVRLFAGSEGRLGVITELAFKVLPAPAVTRNLVYVGLPVGVAVDLMARALASDCEVSAACHIAGIGAAPARTVLRLEGRTAASAARMARLAARLAPHQASQDEVLDWAALGDLSAWQGQAGDLWRIMLKPTDAPPLWEALLAAPWGDGQRPALRLDWGGGLIWALVPAGCDLRRLLPDGVNAMRLRGEADVELPRRPPLAAGVAALEAGLTRAFDPRGLFAGEPS